MWLEILNRVSVNVKSTYIKVSQFSIASDDRVKNGRKEKVYRGKILKESHSNIRWLMQNIMDEVRRIIFIKDL